MEIDDAEVGIHCLYPPRVVAEVDVTEQVEGEQTRYVVRNRATARYFLLKPIEYQIFRRFEGAYTPAEMARGEGSESGPRPSLPSLIKFLTKLDSLGLIARSGDGADAGEANGAAKRSRGFYMKFPLFNPNSLLKWLDQRIGWALTKGYIIASFVVMALVTLLLLARRAEIVPYTARIHSEYGVLVIMLFVIAVTVMHELSHGLACKHFGGDVREIGVLLIFYAIPAFYCNVTDVYRLGRKQQRLWVIFAGIYFQLTVGALGGLIWLIAKPQTRLADLGFLVFFAGTLNVFVNCNPLIKLDCYYALSQLLGVQNLQANSSAYVRSLVMRWLGREAEPLKGPQRPVLYVTYWAASLAYTLFLIWFIINWASGWLIGRFGLAGKILTIALIALFSEKLWRPVINRGYRALAPKFKRRSRYAAAGL
jgi:putative peptide zinc metalloprotease protein